MAFIPLFLNELTMFNPIFFALFIESDRAKTDGPDPEIPDPIAPLSNATFFKSL